MKETPTPTKTRTSQTTTTTRTTTIRRRRRPRIRAWPHRICDWFGPVVAVVIAAIVVCLLADPSRAFVVVPSSKQPPSSAAAATTATAVASTLVKVVGTGGDSEFDRAKKSRPNSLLPSQATKDGTEAIDSNRSRENAAIVVNPIPIPTQQQQQQQQQQQPTQDLVDLSDLRYDEWIAIDDGNSNGNGDTIDDGILVLQERNPPPSKYAFRMATAEIAAERSQAGAVVFLARLVVSPPSSHEPERGPAIGAAELSPIEFEGTALLATTTTTTTDNDEDDDEDDDDGAFTATRLYVTDVLASHQFRRMGVANALMDALENYSWTMHHRGNNNNNNNNNGSITLYLHVEKGNDAAMAFYENSQRGYSPPSPLELRGLDTSKLEANANTSGQTLLCKTLQPPQPPPQPPISSTTKDPMAAVVVPSSTGFGSTGRSTTTTTATTNNKKKKKAKRRKKK